MAAERSHLLVLGVRGSELGCPGAFASRLLAEEQQAKQGKDAEQPPSPLQWMLTTKYYRAELAIHVRHAELLEGREAAGDVLDSVAGEEETGGGPHGVVIVVDGRDGIASMEAWRPW